MDTLKYTHFGVFCPVCDQRFQITLSDIGKTAKCPYCTRPISIEDKEENKNDINNFADEFDDILQILRETI